MRNLAAQNLCHRLAVEGGWYAVLRVPVLGSDEDLAIALLRATGVLLHPGHFYNFPGEGYLVASLITPTAEFSDGIGRALKFTCQTVSNARVALVAFFADGGSNSNSNLCPGETFFNLRRGDSALSPAAVSNVLSP